jgi:hypothetical protein
MLDTFKNLELKKLIVPAIVIGVIIIIVSKK